MPALFVVRADVQPKLVLATAGSQFQLQLHGLKSNEVYQIEASTNLRDWTAIGQRAASNGTVTVTDPQAGKYSQRYYQAVAPADLTGLGADAYAPDKILVKPKLGVDLGGLNLSLGVTVLNVFPAIGNLEVVQVPPGTLPDTLIALYLQSGLVQYAEPDFYVHALATPNDQDYPYLWGFHNTGQFGGVTNDDIDAPDAWDVQNSASNIIVAVVDTGVRYTHQDLAANMWVNPADGSHGTNVVANGRASNDPWDDYGHGTHCAGIIGAAGNNAVGVAGVAWNIQIMACKFLDTNGVGTIDGAIACMDFARASGAKIVNASWGATSFTSQSLHDAIASLRSAGILFVAAAGNSSADNDTTPLYPASYSDLDNIIAVAASDESDNLASFSDYGATNVSLAAPGLLIYSCWNSSDSDYQYEDGTSMACAMVSGAAAVMEAHFPGESYLQIKQQILANVDQRSSLQGKCTSGGRLNLYKALTGGSPPPPTLTASFSANPSSGQAPLNVQFTDTSTGNPASWNWNFGDGTTATTQNPSHTFSSAGSYTVTQTVTGSGGATSSANQTITATSTSNSAPVITLTATQPDAYFSNQAPGAVNFHRTGDTSQSYQVNWSFSGTAVNGVDFQQLPTNSPFPAGQSDATLTITPINHGQTSDKTVVVTLAPGAAYQAGSPDTATVTIHASVTNAAPVASFTANPTRGQAPLTVQFTDTSSGSPVSWNWNFGDGATSTTQNPAHTFGSAGNFTVTLTVANGSGQTSSASQVITVTNAPSQSVVADFSYVPTSGAAPLTVQFTDKSTGSVAGWDWNFGDGSTDSTAQNPSHTYNSAGNFTATLTVTGTDGSTSSKSQTVVVTNAAAADINILGEFDQRTGTGVSIPPGDTTPSTTDGTDFGYVTVSNGVAGSTFAIQNTGNATLTISLPITLSGPNAADFSVTQPPSTNLAAGATMQFEISFAPSAAGTRSATVNIGNSVPNKNPYTFAIQGTGTNAPVQPVNAAFAASPSSGQAPLAVNFTDQSSGPVSAWSWSFGDGSSSTAQNPSHTYSSAGTFTATLTVTGSSGQTSSASQAVTVTNAPQPVTASFSANPTSGQAPLTVQFTDQSTGPVTAWSWNFGDGSTSSVQNPSHIYSSSGNFTASLTVAGSSGQMSSTSRTITVTNAPPPPPSATVTVVATQPLATSLTPGVFSISRTGDTSSALTVNYSLGGTAQNGVDYQTLTGVVTIPAGSSTATVTVNPLGLINVLKTVVLTVSPESTYTVGSPGSATVEIVASLAL